MRRKRNRRHINYRELRNSRKNSSTVWVWLGFFALIFLSFVILFILQKPLFMLGNFPLYKGFGIADWFQAILHGIPLDLSVAGYFTVIPGLLLIISVLTNPKAVSHAFTVYFFIVSLAVAVLFVADTGLYSFWGFHLDNSLMFYLKTPKEAFASVSVLYIILAFVCIMAYFLLVFWFYRKCIVGKISRLSVPQKKPVVAVMLLLATGLLFIPIRGGFSVSTMNIGRAYYSSDMLLNHAAVNVEFNFMSSLAKPADFGKQYRFMDSDEAYRLFGEMTDKPVSDSIPQLINCDNGRPNVILVVLEGFSAITVEPLGGVSGVTPNLAKLAKEGVLFTNFYANSFRTDRGLVAITSAYPAQPTTSIMKYPQKSQTLPSIPKTLKNSGYNLEFYYGGDIDFTNMRSYFISCGIEKISSDKDYPIKDRLSKWGAPDHLVFGKLEENLKQPQTQPFFKMMLTLSSHEPFDVPYNKFEDPYLNSVAYTDSCLGHFMDEFRKTPYWDNTIVVFVPDHAAFYPQTILNYEPKRYHIPLIWAGGALKKPEVIAKYGSQVDLAATLLYQLGLPHSDFTFSKNMLNDNSSGFAFYTFKDGFGLLYEDGSVSVYDNEASKELMMRGGHPERSLSLGKAYLQSLYDDLSKR